MTTPLPRQLALGQESPRLKYYPDPSQPQELLASFVRAGTSSRGFCVGVFAPNPAMLVPKGRRLVLNRSPRWDVVMRKKHAARLESPLSHPKMDYTQPRFDRIDSRIFCHPSTSRGKALGVWCESLDLPLPPRGSPTCSPALAR